MVSNEKTLALQQQRYVEPMNHFSSAKSLANDRSSATSSGRSSPVSAKSFYEVSPLDGAAEDPSTLNKRSSEVRPIAFGVPGTVAHRIAMVGQGGKNLISTWQDVPLFGPNGFLSCVCKTPAGNWLRYEIAVDEPFHPLRVVRESSKYGRDRSHCRKEIQGGPLDQFQEDKQNLGGNSSQAYVHSSSGHESVSSTESPRPCGWAAVRNMLTESSRPQHYPDNVPWNICMLPQTWAGSAGSGELSGAGAANVIDGLIEVVEIGATRVHQLGEVYLVKPLGGFSVEDKNGEVAWKVVAIAADDPMAPMLQDVGDVLSQLPGMLDLVREWLETCDGSTLGAGAMSRRGGQRVKGPYLLASTQSTIQNHYMTWLRNGGGHADSDWPDLIASSDGPITAKQLATAWAPYTAKDRRSLLDSVPVSCPASESCVLFEPDWLGSEEVIPRPLGRPVSESGALYGEPLSSPDSVLPLRGALFRSVSLKVDAPPRKGGSVLSAGKRGMASLWSPPQRQGVGGSPSGSEKSKPKGLPSPTPRPNTVKLPQSKPSPEAAKSRPILGNFRLGSSSSSSKKSKDQLEQSKPVASLGAMAVRRMAGPPGLASSPSRSPAHQ